MTNIRKCGDTHHDHRCNLYNTHSSHHACDCGYQWMLGLDDAPPCEFAQEHRPPEPPGYIRVECIPQGHALIRLSDVSLVATGEILVNNVDYMSGTIELVAFVKVGHTTLHTSLADGEKIERLLLGEL